ncbi:MAG: protein kinase [Deltaproteobacteria bacterium]|nr:protein kinase [Deltaproteobacteria bacterium]MBW2210452.1 protein kinase [Deltaproteobacteria bacterium]MBW2550718.1 protein kinase [Deltaproteobacteria bacterium]MBW2627736.1 protein kinase [Deltaproteobacteria bacterium]
MAKFFRRTAEESRVHESLELFSDPMFPSPGGAHPPPEELFAGRYAVDGALPWGGLVSYYRGSSEGTPLILSVLPMDVSQSTRAEAAFSHLAHGLGSIRSRSVPRVLDAGVIEGVPYLAFQDTRGTLLSDILRDRPLSSLAVLRLATHVLDALDAGHAQALVHGDLTPQNIIVTRERGGKLGARVIGIGVAPLLRANPEASAHAAHTGSGKHSVAYMAPELFGAEAFDASVDLYSAGALLHHMVIGSPPVGWETDEGFDDVPGLPDVVRRAMARRPQNRYPDAASMRAALEWIEVESAKQSPHTQDIAPWMETSHVGSIPVAALASNLPPPHASSSHPAGKILSTSGARPIPIEPIVIEELDPETRRRWRQIALLLILLGTLVFSGYWWKAQTAPNETTLPFRLDPNAQHGD